ncbi:CLUMA_CG012900, isoform A [Clunio marinus]|uniref:CLUMA_CG012900, isoform A n=1 Tax=Clunio marinus TaxID=568069 RepID=A0A1J1IJ67_9DIPT|nr:CLUMA_CG012900, isoform A [Clunio marinus]
MGLKECEIKLDSPINTYFAGQTVNGTVMYSFDSPKKVRGIKVRFLGEARTSWVETEKVTKEDGKTENERKDVTGHEEYFQITYYLLGGINASETELPAGAHAFPFTCALPPTLPSSFEGEFGHIRYTIKVTLDRPWKFDQDTKMAFTVISPVDLNLMEAAAQPGKLVMEKTFWCCCCATPPLSVVVSIPVKGYVSGQSLPLLAEIDNKSSVEVEKIKFQFKKHTAFHTTAPKMTKKNEKVVGELAIGPFNKSEQRTVRQSLDIPPLPPSNLDNCGIIDLHYALDIVCEVSGFHTNLGGAIPITIGTIPLRDYKPQAPESQQSIDISMMPTQPVSPDNVGGAVGWNMGGTSLYPNVPPPNFSESDYQAKTIKDREDNEHTRLVGNQDAFAPRYPVYTFQPSAPRID